MKNRKTDRFVSTGRISSGLVGAFALALTGCAATQESGSAVPCDELLIGRPDAAVMILADGPSESLQQTLDTVAREPELLFGSTKLGLDAESGSVIVATYDYSGNVSMIGRFNLAGVGDDDVRRENDARRQAECLGLVAQSLPDEAAEGPNLLRSLDEADEILQATGAETTALVVHGFSHSDNDGFVPAEADLSQEQRPNLLSLLVDAEVVSTISQPIQFVAPADDVESGIQEQHIEAFIDEFLCPAMTTHPCGATNVLL